MQAQRPPEIPMLHSQMQRNRMAGNAGQPIPSAPEKKSFLRTMMPGMIMMSAIVGISYLGWHAYQASTGSKDISEVPVIKAETTPYKIKPLDAGGEQIANLDKQVYNAISGTSKDSGEQERIKTVDSVEEPINRQQLAEMGSKDRENYEAPDISPASGAATNDTPDNAKKVPLPVPDYYINEAPSNKAPVPVERPATSDAEEMPELPAKPMEQAQPEPVAEDTPGEGLNVVEQPAVPAAEPAKKEAAAPVKKPESKKKTEEPKVAKSVPAPASMTKPATIDGEKIQLGAFRSSEEVKETWNKLKSMYPSLLGNFNYGIQKADLGTKGVFYRLQAGPLDSKEEASILCKKLIAKGQGCFVVN